MYRPILSFILSLLSILSLLMIGEFYLRFNFFNLKKTQPDISLVIDAKIGDVSNHIQINQHELPKQFVKSKTSSIHDPNHIEHDQLNSPEKKQPNQTSTNNNSNAIAQSIKPIHQPLPAIPDDLRYHAMKTKAIAEFSWDENGKVITVKLIQPSQSIELNQLLIKYLYQWQFPASTQKHQQQINITFEVKD